MSIRYVAGIGARDAPFPILQKMIRIGTELANDGWHLRSGGAKGADSAFEKGWTLSNFPNNKQIFLPWKGYNGNSSALIYAPQSAYDLIDSMWDDVKDRPSDTRDYFARNCQQILGPNLDEPSDLVICWTKGGKVVRGTGRAMQVAMKYDIPIVNLAVEDFNPTLFGF
jgi:hypothetical protein